MKTYTTRILAFIACALSLSSTPAKSYAGSSIINGQGIWNYSLHFLEHQTGIDGKRRVTFRLTDTVDKYGKSYKVFKAVSGTEFISLAYKGTHPLEYYLREENGRVYMLPPAQMLEGARACSGLTESDEFILYDFSGGEEGVEFETILFFDTDNPESDAYRRVNARMAGSDRYVTADGIDYPAYLLSSSLTDKEGETLRIEEYISPQTGPAIGLYAWLDTELKYSTIMNEQYSYALQEFRLAAPTIDESRTWEYLEYERLADGRVGCSAIGCRFDGKESVGDREYSVFKTVYRKSWVMDADEDFSNPRNISEITTELLDERRALLREQAGILYRYVDADLADAAADADGISLTEGEEIPLYDFNLQAGEIPAVYAFSPEGACIAVDAEISETEDLLVDGNKGQIIRGDFPDYAEFAGVIADGFLEMPLTASTPEKKIIFNNLYDADGNIIYRGNDDQTLAGLSLPSAAEPSAVEYYNLQGVRIDNPAKGQTVIRRHAGRSEKIIIR